MSYRMRKIGRGDMHMVSTRGFSELLLSLHSASTDTKCYEHFLDLLCKCTNSTTAFVIERTPQLGVNRVLWHGGLHTGRERVELYTHGQQVYAEHYGSQDPYHFALLNQSGTGFIPGEQLIATRTLHRSEMYHRLLSPNRLEHMCLASILNSKSCFRQLAIWRETGSGEFSTDECEWLSLLIPHLQASISLQSRLKKLTEQTAYGKFVLDASPDAIFVLDLRLRIVFMNQTADALLTPGRPFSVKARHLAITEQHSNRNFQEVLRKTVENTLGIRSPVGALQITLADSAKPIYVLVAPAVIETAIGFPATHIIVLVKRDDAPDPLAQLTEQLWGFTQAEAAVADHLVRDYTIDEIASARSVCVGTVRNQVKSLLSKTGTRRQSELVRTLLRVCGS